MTSGGYPLAYWRYWELTKNSANRPKKTAATPMVPVRSLALANSRGSRSGCGARRACAMNPAVSSAAAANEPMTVAEPQP